MGVIAGHQESFPIGPPTKAELYETPLEDTFAEAIAWPQSFELPDLPKVLADPLPQSAEMGSNLVTARIIQRGGHTFSAQAAQKLNKVMGQNYLPREFDRALENLKISEGIDNDNHQSRIYDDGTVEYEINGKWINKGNLLDWLD